MTVEEKVFKNHAHFKNGEKSLKSAAAAAEFLHVELQTISSPRVSFKLSAHRLLDGCQG